MVNLILFSLYFTLIIPFSVFGIDFFNDKKTSICGCPNEFPPKPFYKKYFPQKIFQFHACKNPSENFNSIMVKLRKIVKGQDESIRLISSHLAAHSKRSQNSLKNSPLVLHFAGDIGVGKTLTASAISVFLNPLHFGKDPIDHYFSLFLSGSNYLARQSENGEDSEKQQNEKIKRIRNSIIRQIKKCKFSLIVINDLQKMDSEIFSKLEDIFEGVAYTDSGKPVVTKDSIFIFTSDLGSADSSRNWSYFKLESEIKSRFNLYTNFNRKLNSLVVHVPFKSLGKKAIQKIINSELKSSLSCKKSHECFEFNQSVINFLYSKYEKNPLVRKMNGRAFNKYIFPTFVESEIQEIKPLKKMTSKKRLLSIFVKKINKNDKNYKKFDKIDKKDIKNGKNGKNGKIVKIYEKSEKNDSKEQILSVVLSYKTNEELAEFNSRDRKEL